ncbi:hypothetical protein DIURU_002954 [Diutina rugosa]|uniref:RING-type E3 ubiquitin transferase n=1 Tax=Diutina rugosa TaxID=5481 RepID=A0A642USK8_DIURU|nr:uncharacterized protein DIURU_002954 [Diutina rugosa]KAA8902160.1 hypothetical protein DIURU_002954 [Diutina rugosa]
MSYFDDHNLDPNSPDGRRQGSNSTRSQQTLASALNQFFVGGTAEASEVSSALQVINSELAEQLLEQLKEPSEGVDDEFLASLERVSPKVIEKEQCPICTANYCEDPHPLVVKLPCSLKSGSIDHHFDLECIGPWLKVNSTCPLCRFDVHDIKKLKREKLERELKEADDEDEDDWDDNYG